MKQAAESSKKCEGAKNKAPAVDRGFRLSQETRGPKPMLNTAAKPQGKGTRGEASGDDLGNGRSHGVTVGLRGIYRRVGPFARGIGAYLYLWGEAVYSAPQNFGAK